MRHKDLIRHLYLSSCSVCRDAAMEFEKYLKKYWELKQEVDRLNMIVEHMEDEKYEQKL